ncbi:conserved hypothetical protein [Segniliparus rotundus DSM 44985]|uniref:AAA family ATPase n=1 Tax=Segniliparus rotundus (strain ATCC BAA-972 / CDC 1076 / CIP 108378 / DSM 44985 / JCM 13578) TaxID=640132 RepID=D6ZAT6_SEGRD|nr:bifunctional aminoglycoside phosphotransferase/ATP-binding protein [Segniliparus rotundus]ADG98822.1 conserved hypothetical protein [Segniliparus rotundus DSM 44985]
MPQTLLDTAAVAAVAHTPYADVAETHSGVVFLVGDRAYKLKKPIATAFLDFRRTEDRERACIREVELNRRFSPDVYLGVAHLTEPGGGPDEPVVVMRRMPEEARLSLLALGQADAKEGLGELARKLASFHRLARRSAQIDAEGTACATRRRWQANLTEIRGFAAAAEHGWLIDRVERLAADYLHGREPLFADRIAQRRIIDGHGDLIADDVFLLPDGPRVLDCLDFDDRLRFVDGADDAAFLVMDLEHLGRADLAGGFLGGYLAAAEDPAPRSLVDHYIAYRALVRAKVEFLRFEQGCDESRREARQHLAEASAHLERGAVRLMLVGGLPGTGKSTLANALAERVGAQVISSDLVRHELKTARMIAGELGQYASGLYSPELSSMVYQVMFERARDALSHGESVILDASWGAAGERERAQQLGRETDAAVVALRCTTPPDVAERRIAHRRAGFSDATADIARAMATDAGAWTQATDVDTSAPLETSAAAALAAWERAAQQIFARAESPHGDGPKPLPRRLSST